MSCVDLVTLLTVEVGVTVLLGSGEAIALRASGSAGGPLGQSLRSSSGAGVDRNQALRRACAGEASGLGDSEGNEVRLFVSTSGSGPLLRLRLREALEGRLEGRTRCRLRLRGLEIVDVCEAVRTRSAARGLSRAAMCVKRVCGGTHSGGCGGEGVHEREGGGVAGVAVATSRAKCVCSGECICVCVCGCGCACVCACVGAERGCVILRGSGDGLPTAPARAVEQQQHDF